MSCPHKGKLLHGIATCQSATTTAIHMPPHVCSAAIHLPAAGPCNPPARLQTVTKCVTPNHHVLSHQNTAVPTFGTATENENQANGGPLETANCVCSVYCECGRTCVGQTVRWWVVRLGERRRNLQEGHLEMYILAQPLFEENRRLL
jgi:hypothetical protein